MDLKKKIIAFFLIAVLITPVLTFAQKILPDCTADGSCGLCQIVETGINIFRWILGMLGGAALLLFVWHGSGWIMSAGNTEKIEKSKKGLIHTVIGIAIILGSWMIVNITITLLTAEAGTPMEIGQIFSGSGWKSNWNKYCGD